MVEIKAKEVNQFTGTGRRKTAVARTRLSSGTGKITINGRAFENYFPLESLRGVVTQPLLVTGMADKYDASITVSGGGPSGQAGAVRHSLARALLADPAILLLDEATASLDSESESFIQDGLAALRSNRTTFVIAHRLSTILSADQIVVLENGRLVERGTHSELVALGGRYAELAGEQEADALV